MIEPGRLYERAAVRAGGSRPLWHLDIARTLFIGPLRHNGAHQHGAPVFLVGVHGRFHLRIRGRTWRLCRTAVIPAGVVHELDVHGEPIAVFYVEPTRDGMHVLLPLMRDTREVDGALVGAHGEFTLMRELWEDDASRDWVAQALDDLQAHAGRRAARHIDPRVSRTLATMQVSGDECVPVARHARAAGLSASRFQHLFTREVGVPYRRYRAWCRMRAAIDAIAGGSNFTDAAHVAGFSDQAHFCNDFRRTFGAPPSVSLIDPRR